MNQSELLYGRALAALKREKIPFMVGGAFALRHYTGIDRDTKDLDVFLRQEDVESAMRALADEEYWTELTDPLWLAKAGKPGVKQFIDLIFSSGNGVCPVDDLWFQYSEQTHLFGVAVRVVPPEEMLFSKAFVMARDRYDGADVAHLILVLGDRLDWDRVVWRFGDHWPVLLSHLTLFPYIYPAESWRVPQSIKADLLGRASREEHAHPGGERVCNGSLLNPRCYRIDTDQWGYRGLRRSA